MKLSELVNYRCELDALSVKAISQPADAEIQKITYLVDSQKIQISKFAEKLEQKRQAVLKSFEALDKDLSSLRSQLKKLIETEEKPWFQESYRLYEQEMIYETPEYILNRRPEITPETEQFYHNRLIRYNTWQHPAMIIRPGMETYIGDLLASDPLYLVDENHDLLLPALSRFNEHYQNRLRTYTINERQDQEIFHKLPDAQFGLVFAYNYFNFRPFEMLKKHFAEIYQKLKPGGMFVFTFNDCDRDKGVMLVEQHFCCYTPGYLVRELAQSIGFEIVFSWTDLGPSTWLELKKPGELESLRGGQALAKVIPK
jgi:SAM-dependent methyltransferase